MTEKLLSELSFRNHGHTWIFRFDTPEAVLPALGELARSPTSPFDWFDAAVVSYQLSPLIFEKLMQEYPDA